MDEKLALDVQTISDHFNAIRALLRRGAQTDLAESGLTLPQVSLLRALAFKDGLTLRELSEQLSLAHSTVSGIVDRLEQKDLVQRRSDSQDKRYTRIYLSSQVNKYLRNKMRSHRATLLAGAIQQANESERAMILNGLATLQRLLEAEMAAGTEEAEGSPSP